MKRDVLPEVGTNIIVLKAQRSFQAVKAQLKRRNLIFFISETQHNFRNKFFPLVEAQRNCVTAVSFQVKKAQSNFRS